MPYYFVDKKERKQSQIAQIIALGRQLGKTDKEIQDMIKKAEENGDI